MTNEKKEMLEKLTNEKLYTPEEVDNIIRGMQKHMDVEIERARIQERIYKELLFKVLKIEASDKLRWDDYYEKKQGIL